MTDPAVPPSRLAATFARMQRWPLGRWLFARVVCCRTPYFATIAPRFLVLQPDRCEGEIRLTSVAAARPTKVEERPGADTHLW